MEKKEILDSFNCEHFNGEELVTVVGTSGLFSREGVEEMFVERFRKCGKGTKLKGRPLWGGGGVTRPCQETSSTS